MAKKPTADFETTLKELEQIVGHLEAGDLPLEEALTEFETVSYTHLTLPTTPYV